LSQILGFISLPVDCKLTLSDKIEGGTDCIIDFKAKSELFKLKLIDITEEEKAVLFSFYELIAERKRVKEKNV
jgi:hypothetical protein